VGQSTIFATLAFDGAKGKLSGLASTQDKSHRRHFAMALLSGAGDDHRTPRTRRFLFAAFGVLVVLWTIKLSFPQHSVISVYSNHMPQSSSENTSKPQASLVSKPTLEQDLGLAGASFNANASSKVAVIIETRYRSNLIPLILHFSTVLGPTWPILIYTDEQHVGNFSASAPLARYMKSGLIQIRTLPSTVVFSNSNSVSAFLTQKWLWESLAPAENILLFQSDSILCANAPRSVDDFFEYDFVGAPIDPDLGWNGFNGGLSLRKRSTTLRILDRWDWEKTKKEGDRFEDQWYFNRLVSFPNIKEE
jgi:hypothetical protein